MSSIYGSLPANSTARWHPEPEFRGTFSILSSCLITMALCVWTAVHLNIPQHGETGFITPQTWRKVKWLLIGLFAPEMIAWVAFKQRNVALYIHRQMSECFGEEMSTHEDKRFTRLVIATRKCNPFSKKAVKCRDRHDWTMVHSHYLAMGGLAVDITDPEFQIFEPKQYTQLTLTERGIRWIHHRAPELIPNIPEAEIWDRSKANGLTKTLVCLQTTWFCAQCIGRLSQQFTISLLELNTFAHALCTLLVYILWWHKPLDIKGTTLVHGPFMTQLTALLLVQSISSPRIDEETVPPTNFLRFSRINFSATRPEQDSYTMYALSQPSGLIHLSGKDMMDLWREATCSTHVHHAIPRLDLDRRELKLLNLAMAERLRSGVDVNEFDPPTLCFRVHDVPRRRPSSVSKIWLPAAFFFASLSYGCLHLTAWNAPFPSSTQKLLWQMSALGLVALGLFYSVCILIGDYFFEKHPHIARFLIQMLPNRHQIVFDKVLAIVMVAVLSTLPLYYVFCRAFLLVECFLVMGHLPESVYQVPRWSQYFPHLG